MKPSAIYDVYWKFAAERHAIYERKIAGATDNLTDDPILGTYRFTNVYRAADRVSQYLIRNILYRADRSAAPQEIFFRTLLFKIFNKIETWELLEAQLGPLSWQSVDLDAMDKLLDRAMKGGARIYSPAYIMPAPRFGAERKHTNHLRLLSRMMEDGLPARIERAPSLKHVYELLRAQSGIGSFLAFQYAIDLNYSSMIDFDEADFVVAGPGALDGIAKCFSHSGGKTPEEIIYRMADIQEQEFMRLGIIFGGLFGRRLQPIDCQNLFCEISKYTRVSHPDVTGLSGRTRIKQTYRQAVGIEDEPFFPPKWKLRPNVKASRAGQFSMVFD
ncbi:nucleotide kinase domain-containing protein [Sphingopyxis alaskensis]|uniref:nucleotide kinase domain-containing protein n=1 Tax=Sphingopyxis alaskensis TaxID=117207 RepID=UPI00391D236E